MNFMQLIDRFAQISDPSCPEGVDRPGYSRLERDAHSLFADFMRERGLAVRTDAVGNTVAELPGTGPGLGAIGTGSHLDSVHRAGRFDGIAGVVTAMLIADRAVAEGLLPRHPWRFVVFATEEGARFGQACIGSRFATGTPVDLGLVDASGTTLAEAMTAVGLRPAEAASARWSAQDWSAFIELHVEQGPALAAAGVDVGVVDRISGSSRFEVTFDGVASHSGGTPMGLRADALAGASEFILACEAYPSQDAGREGLRVTVGKLSVEPGGITTIPGRVVLSVDVRDTEVERMAAATRALELAAIEIAERRGLGISVRPLAQTAPAGLSTRVVDALSTAASEAGASHRVMASGASHDAQNVASLTDVGMLFVPSLNGGVSHSPDELSEGEALARGVDVVYRAMVGLDRG
ncbi:Zn-dependent hydrolase [Corynebacterium guangdongense]|uniref:Hydantoinase/carbamoylase family amidase n=1 Tax=Corynebacterium guangdongense TaxID=1783348 RepID=A0ABU1ZVE5_9CORY|nr:Zn-dependent hydrolase [Corynebacterium guangdongense]MDR7328333.1 hydantoinase/carbamoylase family amidase [Corynebacterium guangdongense]WJZ16911.1 putative hydrolase [Corynebacterium guangdongense]